MKKGLLTVVSAPSGAGKSSLCRAIRDRISKLHYSISTTTRLPRTSEVDGQDYFFTTDDEFKKRIDAGEFLEWAVVHGCYYGTSKNQVTDYLSKGYDVILDVDPQGATSVKEHYPDGIYVFVVTKSWEALEKRLRSRAQDDEKTILKRLKNAKEELSHLHEYKYVIVNEDFHKALGDLESIMKAEHCRLDRYAKEEILKLKNLDGGK